MPGGLVELWSLTPAESSTPDGSRMSTRWRLDQLTPHHPVGVKGGAPKLALRDVESCKKTRQCVRVNISISFFARSTWRF